MRVIGRLAMARLMTLIGVAVLAAVMVNPARAGASPPGDGPYLIIGLDSRKCVDVINGSRSDGARIQQWKCDGTTLQQQWYFVPAGGGTLRLEPNHAQNPQECLDVYNGGTGDLVPLQQWRCNSYPQQRWHRDQYWWPAAGQFVYRFRPAHAPTKCMDVTGWGKGNGVRLQTYSCFDNPLHANQLFLLARP